MNRTSFNGLFLLIFFSVFAVETASAQNTVDWAGGASLGKESPVFIKLHFEFDQAGGRGFFHSPGWQIKGRQLARVSFDGTNLHFEFPSQDLGKKYTGDGQLKDGVISGKIRFGTEEGSFHLVRLAPLPAKLYENYVGAYRIAPDRVALITWGTFGHLRLVDLKSGGKDFLLPSAESTFFLGSSVTASPGVNASTVKFNRNESGIVTSMTAKLGGQEITAPKVDLYKQELVTFQNGPTRLSGLLITPSTPGQHPVVVYIEGSGDRTRDDACCGNTEIRNVLERGVAFLLYDKRGTGTSTGDWHTSSFDDLAGDALAAVRLLKRRRDINPRQIGVMGSSQGGWIAPLAASKSKDVAFVIGISAAGVPGADQERFDQVNRLRLQGQPEEILKKADDFLKMQFEAVKSPVGWKKWEAALPAARGQIWASRSFADFPKDHWLWTFWRKNINYDPAPVIQKVRVPVLLLFGEKDGGMPVQIGVDRLEQALKTGKTPDYQIKVFPNAGHSLQITDANNRLVSAPGVDELIPEWILKRVTVVK